MKMKAPKEKISPSSARGQSLIEFELALVVMLFLLLAATDFGMAFFSWITIRDAAQEGASYASIYPPPPTTDPNYTASVRNIEDRVRLSATRPISLLDVTNPVIQVTNASCPGLGVTVTVTYSYHMIMPMVGQMMGIETIPITASVTNTILQAANGVDCTVAP